METATRFGRASSCVTLREEYDIGEVFNEDQTAKMRDFSAMHIPSSRPVVIREWSKLQSKERLADIRRLIQIMYTLQGTQHAVSIETHFEDSSAIYAVLEHSDDSSIMSIVEDKIGAFEGVDAATVVRAMLCAIKACHDLGVVLCNAGIENFNVQMLKASEMLMRVTSLNQARFCAPGEKISPSASLLETPTDFLAPEICRAVLNPESASEHLFDFACDIWTLGVNVHILLFGMPPFLDTDEICEAELAFDEDATHVSDSAKSLLAWMLQKDPAARPSLQQVAEHPWMQQGTEAAPLHDMLVQRIRRFYNMSAIKKLALRTLASQLTPHEIDSLRQVFQQIDVENRGFISMDDLRSAIRKRNPSITEGEIQNLVRTIGEDCSHMIRYEDFLRATLSHQNLLREDQLRKAFFTFDTDGDGFIGPGELRAALSKHSMSSFFDAIMEEADQDGDGKISFDEFYKAVSSHAAFDPFQTHVCENSVLQRPSKSFNQRYTLLRKIGEGGFAEVWLGVHNRSHKKFAIKITDKTSAEFSLEDVRREIQIMFTLQGFSSIIGVHAAFEDSDKVYLVLELCDQGSLAELLDAHGGAVEERDAAKIVSEVLSALKSCHGQNIIHLDVKLDNFLFDNNLNVKCGDFGGSIFCPQGEKITLKGSELHGTIDYLAPELAVALKDNSETSFDHAVDVWSAGVIMFVLLFGDFPFGDRLAIIEDDLVFPHEPSVSEHAMSLLESMLEKDPAKRCTVSEALHHPWFSVLTNNSRPESVVTRLREYSNLDVFSKLVLRGIAKSLDDNQVHGLQQLFESFDTRGKSTVSRQDFRRALRRRDSVISDMEVSQLTDTLDFNRRGSICVDSFVSATMNLRRLQNDEDLSKAFHALDINGDGVLDLDEVEHACMEIGVPPTEAESLFLEVNVKHDGRIDWQQFQDYCKAVCIPSPTVPSSPVKAKTFKIPE